MLWVGIRFTIPRDAEGQLSTYKFVANDGSPVAFSDGDPANGQLTLWMSVAQKTTEGGNTTWAADIEAGTDTIKILKGEDLLGTHQIVKVVTPTA